MAVTTQQVKELREATGVGILDCKNALIHADGDFDKAVDYLREKGLSKAAKRAERESSEGYIELYSHGDGRVGVMLELNCETDFVARSDDFRALAHELALQVAAMSPKYVVPEDVPAEVIEHERTIAKARFIEEGKPEKILDKITDGVVEKFYDETCLMRQEYIRDDKLKIQDLVHAKVASLGENLVVRRFARWSLGEDSSS